MGLKSIVQGSLALTIGSFCALQVQANPDDWVDREVQLASHFANQTVAMVDQHIHFPVLVKVVNRSESSPFLAVVSSRQECFVVINTNPQAWKAWEQFRRVAGMTAEESLQFATLHEIGHCENKLNPRPETGIIPPGPESEFNADLYAISTFKMLYGNDPARSLVDNLVVGRGNYGAGWLSSSNNLRERLAEAIRGLLLAS